MKLVFIGSQGSGKGTQARLVAERFGVCHISVGDLLREVSKRGGELGKEVAGYMAKGDLVSEDLVIRVLKEKLLGEDCEKGFVLDGFPRTLRQADFLDEVVDVDKVVEIFISDEEAVKRVCGRRNCESCGAIYHVENLKPKVEGICDKCGGKLFVRKDDNEEALRERLRIYHEETEPILKRYTCVKVDGEQSVEKVFEDIVSVVEK